MSPLTTKSIEPEPEKPEPKSKPEPEPKPEAEKKPRSPAKTAASYFRANQGFATTLDGEPLFVAKGELVHRDHPLLEGRADLFDPAENFGRFDVEQATSGPGEKR